MISYHLARVQVYVDLIHDEVYIHVKSYKLIKHQLKTFLKEIVEYSKLSYCKSNN